MAYEIILKCGFYEKVEEYASWIIMYNMLKMADPFFNDSGSEYKDKIKFI